MFLAESMARRVVHTFTSPAVSGITSAFPATPCTQTDSCLNTSHKGHYSFNDAFYLMCSFVKQRVAERFFMSANSGSLPVD